MNYYALLVALVLVTALLMNGTRQGNKNYVITACVLLFVIYGLRNAYVIGGDTRTSYYNLFLGTQRLSWQEVIDYAKGTNHLFYLTVKFFNSYISKDYQLYISLNALFVTICFGRMIYRYSSNPLQSILYHFGLLFFTFHFSALKQSIAMAFLMLAFEQIIERKPVKFVLIVLLAGQFHFPALAFLPAYLLMKLHPGRAYLFILAILLLVTYVFRNQILNIMLSLYHDQETTNDLPDVQFLRTKALIMIVITVAAMVFRTPTKEDRIYELLLEFMGVAIVFQTFCGYDNIFERLADYYFQFSVLFIPMIFDRNADRKTILNYRFLEVADTVAPYLFCGYGIYRFLSVVRNDWMFYPFRFFFQK